MTKIAKPTEDSTRPSQSQIDAWKKEHGRVHSVTVKGQELIFRQPKMYDLEVALASRNAKNAKPYDFQKSIIANCKLYEDEGMLTNDEVLLSVVSHIDNIIQIADAEVKEL